MYSSYKLVKNLSNCSRLLRERAVQRFSICRNISFGGGHQWLHSNGRTTSAMHEPQNKTRFQQSRRYDDRFDWRDNYQGPVQSGMDVRYDAPDEDSVPQRFDDVYPKNQSTIDELMDRETFDPRLNEFHYKRYKRNEQRQLKEAQRKRELENQRNISSKYRPSRANDGYKRLQEMPEDQRSLQQDPLEYQKRQALIIEENKRKWMYRRATNSMYKLKEDLNKRVRRDENEHKIGSRTPLYGEETKEHNSEYRKDTKAEEDDDDFSDAEKMEHKAWKRNKEQKSKENYWHSWETCPNERKAFQSYDNEPYPDLATSFDTLPQAKGVVKPPKQYDGSHRRYQTSSTNLSATQLNCNLEPHELGVSVNKRMRRKPINMRKQFKQFGDNNRYEAEDGLNGTSRNYRRQHKWDSIDYSMEDTEPFESLEQKQYVHTPSVKPPRFRMAVKYITPTRRRVPMASLSENLIANTWKSQKSAKPISTSEWGMRMINRTYRPIY